MVLKEGGDVGLVAEGCTARDDAVGAMPLWHRGACCCRGLLGGFRRGFGGLSLFWGASLAVVAAFSAWASRAPTAARSLGSVMWKGRLSQLGAPAAASVVVA